MGYDEDHGEGDDWEHVARKVLIVLKCIIVVSGRLDATNGYLTREKCYNA